MKIDRLIGILSILLQEEKTTAPELAERFMLRQERVSGQLSHIIWCLGGRAGICGDGVKKGRTIGCLS